MKIGDSVRIKNTYGIPLSNEHPNSRFRGVIVGRNTNYRDKLVWNVRWDYPTMYNRSDPCVCSHYEESLVLAGVDTFEDRVHSYVWRELHQ